MIIGTIISTITGITTSFMQDFLKQKMLHKQQELEIELEVKKQKYGLETAKVLLEKEQVKNDGLETKNKIAKVEADAKTYDTFIKNASSGGQISMSSNSKLINFANFWIAITRPNITYLLGLPLCFVIIWFAVFPERLEHLSNYYLTLIEALFYLFDGVLAYWFLRRSSEKFYFNNDFIKKKL